MVEREHILSALKHNLGNRTHTARSLEISIRTLRNKINGYRAKGIEVGDSHWVNTGGNFRKKKYGPEVLKQVEFALIHFGGNIRKAAERVGVSNFVSAGVKEDMKIRGIILPERQPIYRHDNSDCELCNKNKLS